MGVGVDLVIQNSTSEGLPLYYVHASNPNDGNGSVDNPYKNFELLNAFFDANPTVVGATVIVLGGTFSVSENIYRGSSFYFFPGTKIFFTPAVSGAYLLEDDGTYNGYDTDFFFQGDVEIQLYNTGNLFNAGYYYSNASKTAGKKWTIDIASLTTGSSNGLIVNKLYGSINQYTVKIRKVIVDSQASVFIQCAQDERNIAVQSESVIANSGCILTYASDSFQAIRSSFTFIKTNTGTYDFLNRRPVVSIGELSMNNTDFKFFEGKFNRTRKMVFRVYLGIVYQNSISGGESNLIVNNQTNYVNAFNDILFIIENSKFTINTALSVNTYLRLCAYANETWLKPIFINCTRDTTGYNITTDSASAEGCLAVDGTTLTVFNDNNRFICNSIINS